MPIEWYALHSKPRKESVVWQQLLSYNLEAFFPQIRVHPVNPRSRKWRAYFPGYLFVRADLEEMGLSLFQWMPYTVGLLCFGGEPAVVPVHLIEAIRRRVDEINAAGGEKFDLLKPGDLVYIKEGPFAGYEAIFDVRIAGSERVRVLLEFLGSQRRVPLILPVGQIEMRRRIKRS